MSIINDEHLELELGDIIKIMDLTHVILNNQTFIIDYIDEFKIKLINIETFNGVNLFLKNGIIEDYNIKQIDIINKSKNKGYARQHNLLPLTWINIHFNSNVPFILTGKIVELDQDMIEIKLIDNSNIFINFDYKGIPENLPIKLFEIRNEPVDVVSNENEDSVVSNENEDSVVSNENEDSVISNENKNIKIIEETEDGEIIEDDEYDVEDGEIIEPNKDRIIFGKDELGPVTQFIDIKESKFRYNIETQTNDLLNEMLSTIPTSKRTDNVMNNIHKTIERFVQLREQFSTFDENNNISGFTLNTHDYKPLSEYFKKFNKNLYWILPVVKNIKNAYFIEDDNIDTIDENSNSDIEITQLGQDLNNINELIKLYKSNLLLTDDNKYSALHSELNPYFTPFLQPTDQTNDEILNIHQVTNNINVINNTLGNLYSSNIKPTNAPGGMIQKTRFAIQKYNTGLTKLTTENLIGNKTIYHSTEMTPSDTMYIDSFITLPEQIINFSKINLPDTNILNKSNLNLNFLNYWKILNKHTKITTVPINSLENNIELTQNSFANDIKHYYLNLTNTNSNTLEEKYNKFVEAIIPKTRTIFNLLKNNIHGKLSIVDVVGYLEPFLIYGDKLTYMQYIEITKFINIKITEYNKQFIANSILFNNIKQIKPTYENLTNPINELFNGSEHMINVLQLYNIDKTPNSKLLNSTEMLTKIINLNPKLLTQILIKKNMHLMYSNEVAQLLLQTKKNISEKINMAKLTDSEKCNVPNIAKKYLIDETAVINDNNKQIFFDKELDHMPYDILNDPKIEKALNIMTSDEFLSFLNNELQIKHKLLNKQQIQHMTESVINGFQKVQDGDYAVLQNNLIETDNKYYIRKSNNWVIIDDDKFDALTNLDTNIFCNLQTSCINSNENVCEDTNINKLKIKDTLINNIFDNFDEHYNLKREEMIHKIDSDIISSIDFYKQLKTNIFNNTHKYNTQKYNLGIKYIENNKDIYNAETPYGKIRDMILDQTDFVKKQRDIIKFVNSFTRQYFEPSDESPHWFYCNKSGIPLIPTFKYTLAEAFLKNPQTYDDEVKHVITKIGKLTDDGSSWCDMYSGWNIQAVDFDEEEGFTNEGFKKTTRTVLTEDKSDEMMKNIKAITPVTKEMVMINNITNTLSEFMEINIEQQKEFIFNSATELIKQTIITEAEYNKITEHKKTKLSFNDSINVVILYVTLATFLIAIQTSIPSIKSSITFPNCIKSFNGYPVDPDENMSGLNYLACVVYKINDKVSKPWNVLKGKKQESIVKNIKIRIDELLSIQSVKLKINEKTQYNIQHTEENDNIPFEHTINNWIKYRPPLVQYKIKNLLNVTPDFMQRLKSDLKNHNTQQHNKILIVESKIILFSLLIQELIKKIVDDKQLLLKTLANKLYVENSCCAENTTTHSFIEYFEKENPLIQSSNTIIYELSNLMDDIKYYSTASIARSVIDTKVKYTQLSNQFSENTIYKAFISMCKFKTNDAISNELLLICKNKPDKKIFKNEQIKQIINKLKDEGNDYSLKHLLKLLQIVARKNIINFNFNNSIKLPVIEDIMQTIQTNEQNASVKILDDKLSELINNKTSQGINKLQNFLHEENNKTKLRVISFISKNSTNTIKHIKQTKQFFENITEWKDTTNSSFYNKINYYKTFIKNIGTIFPKIIANNINYWSVSIPSYWKLSSIHSRDLLNMLKENYNKFKDFYRVPSLNALLENVNITSQNLKYLSENTINKDFNKTTIKYLFEYYLLRTFDVYINTIDNMSLNHRDDITMGNISKLKNYLANLLIEYSIIMNNNKNKIDVSYETIADMVFKIKEKEKDRTTDRLKALTDDERNADTILKLNKLGAWDVGMQKGFTEYNGKFYDKNHEFMTEMSDAEKMLNPTNNDDDDNDDDTGIIDDLENNDMTDVIGEGFE